MTFYTSLHLVNLKQYDYHHTEDLDCVKLKEKYKCLHGNYSFAKNEYFKSKCSECEHEWRVKRNSKYVDKLLRECKCLFMSWELNKPLILIFNDGTVVSLEFNKENNTLLKIKIDNNLRGKFLSSRITDVAMSENNIYIAYVEPKLTLIQSTQDSPSLLAKFFGRKKGNLVGFEPKIHHFDLSVDSFRGFERKLSLNIPKDLLIVWWKISGSDVGPWTPIKYLSDRVNIILHSVEGVHLTTLCTVRVQDELLFTSFSKEKCNQFFTLEESKKEAEVVVNVCFYEVNHGECQVTYIEKLPVRGNLISFEWSSTEDKLLAADSDGLLMIYNAVKKTTVVTNLEFLPKHLSWHPESCIVLVSCQNNRLLCYDTALNFINFKLCYKTSSQFQFLDLNSYFSFKFSMEKVLWQKSIYNDTCVFLLGSELSSILFVKFSFGCVTRHKVTALEIISQYVKINKLNRSILILQSLDWSTKGDIKYQCLSKIVNCLLRRPLNFDNQSNLEMAFGAFYDWIPYMPQEVVDRYIDRMYHLARRFFHHLLRHRKFRKAFLLAVDLESQDLFLDLHHVAKENDQSILASVALYKASQLYDSSDSFSGSYQSDANSESQSSSGNEIADSDALYSNMASRESSSQDKSAKRDHTSLKARYDSTSHAKEYQQCSSKPSNYNRENILLKSSQSSNYPAAYCDKSDSYSSSSSYPLQHSSVSSYINKPFLIDHSSIASSSKSKTCDKYTSIRSVRDNYPIEEENEEVEGANIKLAHLGII